MSLLQCVQQADLADDQKRYEQNYSLVMLRINIGSGWGGRVDGVNWQGKTKPTLPNIQIEMNASWG